MNSVFDLAEEAAGVIRARLGEVPDVAVVLGTGLGGFAESLADATTIPYADIPHWPASDVVGHAGRLRSGLVGDGSRLREQDPSPSRLREQDPSPSRVLTLSGRVHRYEGHDFITATFGIRVLGRLGVKTLILTNAAGGINTTFTQGALMVIDDHINLLGGNPLIGPNDERFGRRFPDMSEVYSRRLRGLADEVARDARIEVAHGVYIAVTGPSYETPAEIRAFRALGADAVGMSTVPEAIVARHMGLEVLGVSCISNMAAGMLPQPLTEEEVIETTGRVRDRFVRLLGGIVGRL